MALPPAAAQVSITIEASKPITDSFPQITLYLAIVDSTGRRIPGLPESSFSVLEDEKPILDLTINEVKVGTRQIFVINTSADLKVRDAHGQTRFDLARQALINWWQRPDTSAYGIDTLSLITPDGVLVSHGESTAMLAATLDNLTPVFQEDSSGYDLLMHALDFAGDPPTRPGMPSSLIFITSLLRLPRDLPMANIIARARETGTAIYPVLIGQPEILDQPESEPLRELASTTGGQLILFEPTQGLTDLADHFLTQRIQYQLTYTSQAADAEPHQVQVRVIGDGLEAYSNVQSFEIDLQPPEIAFINPPNEILRQTDDPTLSLDALPPSSQTLHILITFPDEYPRPLAMSELIVDGEVVIQHTNEPFDAFEWDLTNYLVKETHTIQAAVEDSLSLRSETIVLPVVIEVESPPRGFAALRPALGSLIAALAVLIAGVILAVSLISMSRQGTTRSNPRNRSSIRQKRRLKRAGMQRQATEDSVEALLVPLDADGIEGKTIPLTGVDFILGRDPSLTPTPFDDPSVSALHARITRQAGGDYLLRDQGSIAGTWVNYVVIPEGGYQLKHGDLIHIGRVTLRFQLASPPKLSEIRVYPALNAGGERADDQETAS